MITAPVLKAGRTGFCRVSGQETGKLVSAILTVRLNRKYNTGAGLMCVVKYFHFPKYLG